MPAPRRRHPRGRRAAALLALAGVLAGVAALLVAGRDQHPATAHAQARPVATVALAGPGPAAIRAEVARVASLRALRERQERSDPHVFPIRGKHDRGRYETNDFGGGRGHRGQDMFADCGTPLVAALGGVVKYVASEGAGGNYLVITGRDKRDYIYMHMAEPARFRAGDKVADGQPIGHVGDSGNADGCHLHFELWTAPGWYSGGEPIDTRRLLAAWDAAP
ncbi:M23 family metallopeptidase [Conexibacter sp. JD483]|uniref:M23 family metallopeptidase n=1 Tax=unclassified Conexibacter TaxID=2627773 RepID=UPI002728A853|nr:MULTISPECIES: M23 family metallopeptidase [unclassified Conexibacter]MDO8187445.1 M23 family metallopeptidase [Conexibacter sp. CPCC 205706]MDO8198679.1 M23 family metallopeptidase [Conexibacter sp. CPCC 205762]MDR9369857.1 M23 family metallopeptidase [Conexibacter sp. JD483]